MVCPVLDPAGLVEPFKRGRGNATPHFLTAASESNLRGRCFSPPTFPPPSTLHEHDARVDSVRAESAAGVTEPVKRGLWTAFALSLLARGEREAESG